MATILIGYDLNKPGQDYEKLFEAIKALGNSWWHCLDSTWLVVTSQTVSQVMDKLKTKIDSSDRLLVIDVGGDSATWIGFDADCSKWIKDHL